jgi:hypothetical protein
VAAGLTDGEGLGSAPKVRLAPVGDAVGDVLGDAVGGPL